MVGVCNAHVERLYAIQTVRKELFGGQMMASRVVFELSHWPFHL
jgi:hypothetical protein